jgi:hypothetical protein
MWGGHHCRHCNAFICSEHTEGFGDQKYCKNKTCYSPEEAARLSLDNMNLVHRKSSRFQGKPMFSSPGKKEKPDGSSVVMDSGNGESTKSHFNPIRFLTFIVLMSILLNFYFPQRIENLNVLLQKNMDSLESFMEPYGFNSFLYYSYQFFRIVYVWQSFALILIYLFFKSL